jgi:hypothetical protein
MDNDEQTAKLRTHIQSLTNLRTQIHALREIPAQLLKVPGSVDLLLNDGTHAGPEKLRNEFSVVRSFLDTVRSAPIQEALSSSKERLEADGSNLMPKARHESRKRR